MAVELSVAVIIPAFNAASVIGEQLRALSLQTHQNFRVVVSDNGSTDGTRKAVEAWMPQFKSLIWVLADGRKGAAHARNTGIRSVTSDLVLICDSDDAVGPDWVAAHVEVLGRYQASTGPLYIVDAVGQERREIWNADSIPRTMNYLQYMPSCNAGFRRAAFDAVGGFDEELWRGHEDVDLGWRLCLAGFTIGHAPDAVIQYVQRSGASKRLKQQFQYGQAFAQLFAKHKSRPIPVQSRRWRARWWSEWLLKNLGIPQRWKSAPATIAFQIGRIYRSRLLNVHSPMW
ncbi:glycosyltransferase family 2 protein [Pseudoclavibacter terrae]|uniref:Glycosyltransferase n=1 Tax=Pseudoclavibacter terrae TaxID=1530195 RepID=A0A7J5B4Z3_9MICO|nr:glycosyltransferase [Pseudoclavibacter terrae]